jgi:hypothetical protein
MRNAACARESVAHSQVPRSAGSKGGFVYELLRQRALACSSSNAWHWALRCGTLPGEGLDTAAAPAQEVLLTGHDDGSVSLWDVGQVSPQQLSAAASGKGSVTAMRLQVNTGLLATGHAGGEVLPLHALCAASNACSVCRARGRLWRCRST